MPHDPHLQHDSQHHDSQQHDSHLDQSAHDHGSHGHGGHGGVVHTPAADALAAYRQAYDAAKPGPGGKVVAVDIEAREMEWEFIPGRRTRAWGYNGQVPGPVLEANMGDVLEVRFKNSIPEPTTLHWHGVRLPAPMDGTDMVQNPIAPGETFAYRFVLPDSGTFWYHPHSNEPVQMELGLYGALVVRGPNEPQLDAERVLVLDDVALDHKGQVKLPDSWADPHEHSEENTRLVNGRSEPELRMAAGQVERWRILNASSARYVRLSIGGHPFTLLGTDGGLLTAPVTMDDVLLAPADRVDIAVGPFAEGERLDIGSLTRRHDKSYVPEHEHFATLEVGPAAPSRATIPETLRPIEPLVTGPVKPTREIVLGFRESADRGMDFLINDEHHHRDQPVRVGDLQVWDIVNDTPVDHPFHLHGFLFQVLEENGTPPAYLSWEDNVNVPANGRVRIAWLPDDRPGEWMYHCHILEHHAAGMMAHFEVVR